MPLGDQSGPKSPAILTWRKVTRAVKAICWFTGTCRDLREMIPPPPLPAPPAMPPPPAGLATTEGIPPLAQAVLHRELLHAHGLLDLTLGMFRFRLAITPLRLLLRFLGPGFLSSPSNATSRPGLCHFAGHSSSEFRTLLHTGTDDYFRLDSYSHSEH